MTRIMVYGDYDSPIRSAIAELENAGLIETRLHQIEISVTAEPSMALATLSGESLRRSLWALRTTSAQDFLVTFTIKPFTDRPFVASLKDFTDDEAKLFIDSYVASYIPHVRNTGSSIRRQGSRRDRRRP